MRNLSAPTLLALAALTAGCGSDTKVHYAKTDNPRYPGEFSLEVERQASMAAARATLKQEVVTKTPPACMPWENDPCSTVLSRKQVPSDTPIGVTNKERCGVLWINSCETEVKDTGTLVEDCSTEQKAVLKQIRAKASEALKDTTALETVWKAMEGADPSLKEVDWPKFSTRMATTTTDTKDTCSKISAFLLEANGKKNDIYGFTVGEKQEAFGALMFDSAEKAPLCERAAAMARMDYCLTTGECDYTSQIPLPNPSQSTPNELQNLVEGFCESPAQAVNGSKTALGAYYGFAGTYTIEADGLHTVGTAKIKDHSVTGDFTLKPDKSTCVTTAKDTKIDLGGGKTLELKFSDCQTPDDTKDAVLVNGSTRTTLSQFGTAGDNFDWYSCGADTDGDCNPNYQYTLDKESWAFTGPVEKKRN